jgi:hypothetical protein
VFSFSVLRAKPAIPLALQWPNGLLSSLKRHHSIEKNTWLIILTITMDSTGQYFSPFRNNGTSMDSTGELCSPFRNNRINVPSVPRFSDFLFPQSTENDTVAITQGGDDTTSIEGARSKNPVTPGGKGEGEAITTNNSTPTTTSSSSSSSGSDPVPDDSEETKDPVTPGGKGEGEVINTNYSSTSSNSSNASDFVPPDDSEETKKKNPVTPGGKVEGEAFTMNNTSITSTSSSSASASASDPVHDDSDDSSLPDSDNMHVSKRARTAEFSVNSVKNHSTAGSSGSSEILKRTIDECLKPTKPITEVLISSPLKNTNKFQYSSDELDDNISVVDSTEKVIQTTLGMNNSTSLADEELQIVESHTATSLARFDGMKQYQKKVSQSEPVPNKSVVVHLDETHKKSIGKTFRAKDKKPAVELPDLGIPYPTGLLNRKEQLLLNKWMKKTRCDEHLMLRNVANTELVYNTFLNLVKAMYQGKCQRYLKKKARLPFASSEGIWNLRKIFQQWVHSLKEGNSEVGKVSRKNSYTERQVDMLDIGLYVHPLRSTLSQRYRSILENKHLKQYFVGKSWQNIHDKLRVHCKSKPWENLLDFYDMQHEFTKFLVKVTNEEKAKMSL